MSDEKKIVNPFDEENFYTGGGGFWEDKVVTVTGARTVDQLMVRGDGTPVLDKTGEQSHFKGLEITGIADDAEQERREQYSAGGLLPTADGEGWEPIKPGEPVRFHSNSHMSEFSKALKESGFDTSLLVVDGKIKVSRLVGARFKMKGVQKTDDKGNPKLTKKGYPDVRYFPTKFVGYREGVAPVKTATSSVLREKAVGAVTAVLENEGGSLGRAEMVRKVSAFLAKDPEANKVIALISRDEFHKDVPWVRDGTSYRLS